MLPNVKQIRIGSLPANQAFQEQQAMCASTLGYHLKTNKAGPGHGCGALASTLDAACLCRCPVLDMCMLLLHAR